MSTALDRCNLTDLHELKGDRRNTWSVRVSGNYRITFAFREGDCWDVDLKDYH